MTDVVIVGAGLAGLACARELVRQGVECVVLDAADAVGGRVRTDRVDGFQIDRGFQVYLTAYPEAQRVLDHDALDLRPFEPGALVWRRGAFERVGDPLRRPLQAVPTLLADVGSPADKLRVLRLRQSVTRGGVDALWRRPEMTTERALRDRYGFSERMVDRFFRPFLGGVFLDRSLAESSRSFEFYFRMFSTGAAAVPAAGMQAIPEQLAAGLPAGTVRLDTPVAAVREGAVETEGGEALACRAVVVATDASAAAALVPGLSEPGWKGTLQLAWAAPAPPRDEAVLMLDGEGAGPVNNVQVMSAVAPTYAPGGQALVTASILGEAPAARAAPDAAARAQLRGWFGDEVDAWRLLAVTAVPHALPRLRSLAPPERPARVSDGLYVTGDWRRNGSINGALVAGRHAAEAVAQDVGAGRNG
ncbi:protoporphyrinogen/coproporphyrinogen oxidase [Rubrivirga litoralis]|uniref:NAD(P)/FAD-dependent oxidoreductase n=1 Tax=Rubrivirga litoralis TaxID=3075598 RepID=A0ABU3BSV3_9BACT|nr:NAD(P)/FAD-dependent oxidoreductase [Rubrivirga sp. F394]MDT0632348.1 NAD(P)/FAD-dependent oxidoreductase [Rubrivirga sp. F394]